MLDSLNLRDTLRGRMTVSKLSCKIPMMKITPIIIARILIYTPSKPSINRHDRFDVDSCEVVHMHLEHKLEQNNFLKIPLVYPAQIMLDRAYAVHAGTRRRPKQYRPVTANSAHLCATPGPEWSPLDPLRNELGPSHANDTSQSVADCGRAHRA